MKLLFLGGCFGFLSARSFVLLGSLLNLRADLQYLATLVVAAVWAGGMRANLPFAVAAGCQTECFESEMASAFALALFCTAFSGETHKFRNSS